MKSSAHCTGSSAAGEALHMPTLTRQSLAAPKNGHNLGQGGQSPLQAKNTILERDSAESHRSAALPAAGREHFGTERTSGDSTQPALQKATLEERQGEAR